MGDVAEWIALGDPPGWSMLWCRLNGGHEWRYHLRKPRRMCLRCKVKQVKREALNADPATERERDDG